MRRLVLWRVARRGEDQGKERGAKRARHLRVLRSSTAKCDDPRPLVILVVLGMMEPLHDNAGGVWGWARHVAGAAVLTALSALVFGSAGLAAWRIYPNQSLSGLVNSLKGVSAYGVRRTGYEELDDDGGREYRSAG